MIYLEQKKTNFDLLLNSFTSDDAIAEHNDLDREYEVVDESDVQFQ